MAEFDSFERKHVPVLDSEMSYLEAGKGDPVVFLHGNPTSSYLWRNIIPHVKDLGRCLAPDLIGMGNSGKAPRRSYRFVDHARYLDAWFDAVVGAADKVILVVHDWGSALGFHWARRHSERIQAIVYMEAIVQPITWEDWPATSRSLFQGLRGEAGEKLVLEKNIFIEKILTGSVLRQLSEEEMAAYRRPYTEAGEPRRPMLDWPREIPVDGEPAEVVEIVDAYGAWMAESQFPKLFINAEPGAILTGRPRAFCRTWPNQQEVTVTGFHYVQEDSPDEIGAALHGFIQPMRK